MNAQGSIQELFVSHIQVDAATQFRVRIDEATVKEYAGLMKDGVEFPPVEVVVDEDGTHWLAHGFHRLAAAKLSEREMMTVSARPGTQRDAVLLALSANHDNGLTRTNDDKRKAVVFCLRDPEIRAKNQRAIAALCGVTQAMVSKVNAEINPKVDNGYQNLTPEQVLESLTPELRALLIDKHTRESTWFAADEAKQLQRAGLITRYSDHSEWTPLAQDVVIQIGAADPLLALERALWQWNNTRPEKNLYVGNLGTVEPALRWLHERAGWVNAGDLPSYAMREWLGLLLAAPMSSGVVQRHVVESDRYGSPDFWHILPKGCQLLGVEPLVFADGHATAPQPTTEWWEAESQARIDQNRREADARTTKRRANVKPAEVAETERIRIAYDLRTLKSTIHRAEYLDVATLQRVAGQLESILKAAGVKTPAVEPIKAEPRELLPAPVDETGLVYGDAAATPVSKADVQELEGGRPWEQTAKPEGEQRAANLLDSVECPFPKFSHVWHKGEKRIGKVYGAANGVDGIEIMVSDPTRPETQILQAWKASELRAATADEVAAFMQAKDKETAL